MLTRSSISISYLLRYSSKRIWRPVTSCYQIRNSSAEPLPLPPADDENKVYPEKIQNIVAEISKLTLLEVADLNDLLKKILKISDAPVMAMGMMGGVPASKEEEEEEDSGVKVQTNFTLKILKFDETKKVPLIKHVKTIMEGMNLVQSKKFVESLPATVRVDCAKEEVDKLKEDLLAVGAECIIE